jgi:hypothetical protein
LEKNIGTNIKFRAYLPLFPWGFLPYMDCPSDRSETPTPGENTIEGGSQGMNVDTPYKNLEIRGDIGHNREPGESPA